MLEFLECYHGPRERFCRENRVLNNLKTQNCSNEISYFIQITVQHTVTLIVFVCADTDPRSTPRPRMDVSTPPKYPYYV